MNATETMIELENLRKEFPGGAVAVGDLSMQIRRGEICVLVGPSGCGKTTTMRMINRLIEPTEGRIVVDGVDVTQMDPVELRRHIGYVIQNVGLFPHQTVSTNVGTVPRLLGWDKGEAAARVSELLNLVGLPESEYGSRYPDELSGGQRQRVGVARALAAGPKVLLMDEPFSAVDPLARDRLQMEFQKVQRKLGTTVVLVTHDVAEAVRLGDRIAVMSEGGVLEQFDTPSVILGRPASDFVAGFVGEDRALTRLAVTTLRPDDVAPSREEGAPPSPSPDDVVLGSSLREAMAAVLDSQNGQVTVRDTAGHAVGTLDPDLLHAAFQRSLPPTSESSHVGA